MCAPERVHVEALLRAGSPRTSEATPERGIADEVAKRVGELAGLARVDEESRLALDDELGDASDPGGDDGKPGSHRLEHGDGQALRRAREDEHIGPGQQRRHVAPVAGEADLPLEVERPDLLLHEAPVGAVADDQGVVGAGRQPGQGADERQGILGRLQASDRDEEGPSPVELRSGRTFDVDPVRDHDRSSRVARPRGKPRGSLLLGHADRDRRQRPHGAVRPAVEERGSSGVRRERPSVRGEDPNRDARECRRQPSEDAGLRAARVDDVRTLAPQEAGELDDGGRISPRAERPLQLPQRQEADAGSLGRLPERAGSVGGDHHVEAVHERREQRRDIGLRAAGLRQRHEQEQARPPRAGG